MAILFTRFALVINNLSYSYTEGHTESAEVGQGGRDHQADSYDMLPQLNHRAQHAPLQR